MRGDCVAGWVVRRAGGGAWREGADLAARSVSAGRAARRGLAWCVGANQVIRCARGAARAMLAVWRAGSAAWREGAGLAARSVSAGRVFAWRVGAFVRGALVRDPVPRSSGMVVCVLLALGLAACSVPRRVEHPGPLPTGAPTTVEGLAAAIQADSARSDRETDGKVRAQLADEANAYGDACVAKDPQAAACLYGRGLALGLEARVHPGSAGELLKSMLDSLNRADAADPNYDNAGPSRVKALVLVRAPGWPLGPGDPDAGLESARRAVELRPGYPPNLLALAEALSKTGDTNGARDAYAKAHDTAQALPASPDREGWLRDADAGLKK